MEITIFGTISGMNVCLSFRAVRGRVGDVVEKQYLSYLLK